MSTRAKMMSLMRSHMSHRWSREWRLKGIWPPTRVLVLWKCFKTSAVTHPMKSPKLTTQSKKIIKRINSWLALRLKRYVLVSTSHTPNRSKKALIERSLSKKCMRDSWAILLTSLTNQKVRANFSASSMVAKRSFSINLACFNTWGRTPARNSSLALFAQRNSSRMETGRTTRDVT